MEDTTVGELPVDGPEPDGMALPESEDFGDLPDDRMPRVSNDDADRSSESVPAPIRLPDGWAVHVEDRRRERNLLHGTVAVVHGGEALHTDRIALADAKARSGVVQGVVKAAQARGIICPEEPLVAELVRLHVAAEANAPAVTPAEPGRGRKTTQAQDLLALCADVDLWHAPDGTAYATFEVEADNDGVLPAHRETWPVASDGFGAWLTIRYMAKHDDKVPGREGMGQATGQLSALARYRRQERTASARVAQPDQGHIYLDLADPAWRCVEVTAEGWRIIPQADAPIRLVRRTGMLTLPDPKRGGTLADLLALVSPALTPRQKRLLLGYLANLLRGRGAHAILALCGPRGSTKTTLGRMIRGLVDPNAAPLRMRVRDERDLVIAAKAGHVVGLDNVSYVADWFSDALSSLATGASFATRALYTNDDEALFAACRPVIYTAIPDVARNGDLAERQVRLVLARPETGTYVPDDEVWARFEAARPRILGALLDVAVDGLRRYPTARPARLPRMAAWAWWAAACEPALITSSGMKDWEPGTILTDYEGHQAEAAHDAVESSAVGAAVLKLLQGKSEWTGTAQDLLGALGEVVGEDVRHRRAKGTEAWPKTPRGLRNALQAVLPDLQEEGVKVELPNAEQGSHKKRTITLAHTDTETRRPVNGPPPPPPDRQDAGKDGISGGGGEGGGPNPDRPSAPTTAPVEGGGAENRPPTAPLTAPHSNGAVAGNGGGGGGGGGSFTPLRGAPSRGDDADDWGDVV